jgi:hypothetical protein
MTVSPAYGWATTGAARVVVAAVAVPVRLTVCGEPDPVLIVTEAFDVPAALGLYATLIVQLFSADTEFPQVFV